MLDYGLVGLYGITVWCLVAPALVALGYGLMKPVLVRAAAVRGLRSSAAEAPPPGGG